MNATLTNVYVAASSCDTCGSSLGTPPRCIPESQQGLPGSRNRQRLTSGYGVSALTVEGAPVRNLTGRGREKLASNFSRCSPPSTAPTARSVDSFEPSVPFRCSLPMPSRFQQAVLQGRSDTKACELGKVDFAEPSSVNVGEFKERRTQTQFAAFDVTVGVIEVTRDHVDFARSGTRACFLRVELEQETFALDDVARDNQISCWDE